MKAIDFSQYSIRESLQCKTKQYLTHVRIGSSFINLLFRYFETISDILNSVKKMEESLKRLKQARKSVTTNSASPNVGMSDDNKIRLQLALDVEHFGVQVMYFCE